jgi:hypothetical protein
MALHFSIYYHSPENGDHLRQAVDSSGAGQLLETKDLAQLPVAGRNGTDVVLLEYQENNPELDRWIETTTADPKNPAVFLVFPEISATQLWKALHLGVKECLTLPVEPEKLQEAVNRLVVHHVARSPAGAGSQIISFVGCKGGGRRHLFGGQPGLSPVPDTGTGPAGGSGSAIRPTGPLLRY